MMGTSERATEATTPSTTVVEAIAAREEWESTELPTPLYESIDPDALDALVESITDGRITFTYLGHEVVVTSDGSVSVAD